jgi:membrane-associated protease RseP (regulator of RpoE activity)
MLPIDTDTLTPIVSRVLKIEDITTGDTQVKPGRQTIPYLVRYRGQLYDEPEQAYDRLVELLRPRNITPLFRSEEGQHVIYLVQGTIKPKPSNPVVNLVLFIFTLLSVILSGAIAAYEGPAPANPTDLLTAILGSLWKGVPFAISLLAILLAHEFGHYLAGRFHHTHVTLPYFIPFPFSPFGTMGAFIQLKEPPKNKRILLDIGIAGPLAGLAVSIPILLYGLSLSHIAVINPEPGQALTLEGNSILYLLAKFLVFRQWLPTPTSFGNLPPLLYWIRYFFTGQPLPLGGIDVMIHSIAWAGWAGLLVTALNLIPAGQLDGGHILYVLLGKHTRRLLPFILVLLILLGYVWMGWWLWALLLFLLGRVYAEPLDQITSLDLRRKTIAILGIVLFILLFTPVPLIQASMGGL